MTRSPASQPARSLAEWKAYAFEVWLDLYADGPDSLEATHWGDPDSVNDSNDICEFVWRIECEDDLSSLAIAADDLSLAREDGVPQRIFSEVRILENRGDISGLKGLLDAVRGALDPKIRSGSIREFCNAISSTETAAELGLLNEVLKMPNDNFDFRCSVESLSIVLESPQLLDWIENPTKVSKSLTAIADRTRRPNDLHSAWKATREQPKLELEMDGSLHTLLKLIAGIGDLDLNREAINRVLDLHSAEARGIALSALSTGPAGDLASDLALDCASSIDRYADSRTFCGDVGIWEYGIGNFWLDARNKVLGELALARMDLSLAAEIESDQLCQLVLSRISTRAGRAELARSFGDSWERAAALSEIAVAASDPKLALEAVRLCETARRSNDSGYSRAELRCLINLIGILNTAS